MTEHTQLLVNTGTVYDPIAIDILPALTHRPYNNLVLVALELGESVATFKI
jgi:hypothetical protein